jgi:nitrogen regulatory protein PII
MGFSVPVITYGTGMGLRDKLGLLRITIPVSKEIISFIVSRHDAEEALHLVSDRARIDHPGRGFIYLFPIRHAVVNTKIRRGEAEKVASIEQIVAAIDEMSGNSVWRRRTAVGRLRKRRAPVLTGLSNYTIYDLEGQTADLVRAAMTAGASGATLSNLRLDRFDDSQVSTITRSREMSDLIIPSNIVDPVLKSSLAHGLMDGESNAAVELSSVEMASTYLNRQDS